MRRQLLLFTVLIMLIPSARAQQKTGIENIIFVTTDGLRWQEVFGGMDSSIAQNPSFNQKDSTYIYNRYWASTPTRRREKLMPFLWHMFGNQGQIYGNRAYNNFVNNANPYWFSYPGYNEIMTGNVDTSINTNEYPPNPNSTLLDYLNKQPKFNGRVAAFGAWNAFDRILNEQRAGFPVVCGYDKCGGLKPNATEETINRMKESAYSPFGTAEALDVFTHYAALEHLKKEKPSVLYISYGETDEWAHEGHYKDYLNAAHQVDNWLSNIWQYIQSTDKYRNKTLLFITVDHGRGTGAQWTSHNNKTPNSDEIWFALLGPGIPPKGEIITKGQLYQKQFAQTIAELLGFKFTCEHPVADGLKEQIMK